MKKLTASGVVFCLISLMNSPATHAEESPLFYTGPSAESGMSKADFKKYREAVMHEYLDQPGFRAILASAFNNSFVYIESQKGGLDFKVCKEPEAESGNNQESVNQKFNYDPAKCISMLNQNADIVIPSRWILEKEVGFTTTLLGIVRVIADTALIGISAVSSESAIAFTKTLSFEETAASGKAWTGFNSNNSPMEVLSNVIRGREIMSKLIGYAAESKYEDDKKIITVLYPDDFAKILSGLDSDIRGLVAHALKNDKEGGIGHRWEENFHNNMNQNMGSDEPGK